MIKANKSNPKTIPSVIAIPVHPNYGTIKQLDINPIKNPTIYIHIYGIKILLAFR